jgi:hypothetical protein
MPGDNVFDVSHCIFDQCHHRMQTRKSGDRSVCKHWMHLLVLLRYIRAAASGQGSASEDVLCWVSTVDKE